MPESFHSSRSRLAALRCSSAIPGLGVSASLKGPRPNRLLPILRSIANVIVRRTERVRKTSLEMLDDPSGIVEINHPEGKVNDPASRIWPFKVHRGKQAYDTGTDQR